MAVVPCIAGVGAGLPERCVSNDELAQKVDTSDAWIRERTGITQRYIAGEGETTASLATIAARQALKASGLNASQLDAIILCTSTPDTTMPSTACLVQKALGNDHAMAFDLNAACSGFVYGLTMARSLFVSGQANNILLIGADTMTRIIDWQDRSTCVLFGDGAGAVVITGQDSQGKGIIACDCGSNGSFSHILKTDGGVSTSAQAGVLHMDGREVFRQAVDKMSEVTLALLKHANLEITDVDWIVPHQANYRIILAISKRLGIDITRFIATVDQHANTSAASIPLALANACQQGQIKTGQMLVLPALGAGLTWGSCIIQW